MKRALRVVLGSVFCLWLLLVAVSIHIHAFQNTNDPYNFVNSGGTVRIIWNYPFEVAEAVRLNAVRFADSFSSADAAVNDVNAGSGPGVVVIPSNYAAAESANLVTVDGQKRYCGPDNVTTIDFRHGTEKNYNIVVGGQVLGSLSRLAVTQCKPSPITTTSAGLFTNFVTGAAPTNNGTLAGETSQVGIYGTYTNAGSVSRVSSFEGYSQFDPTNTVTQAEVDGATFSVNIDRTTAKGNITQAFSVIGRPCTNASTNGAVISECYGLRGVQPTAGANKNYGAWLDGVLISNNVNVDLLDASGNPQHFLTPATTNDLYVRPLLDSKGFTFANQLNNTNWLTMNSTSGVGIPSLKLTLGSGISPDGGGFKHKRGTAGCATTASVGATCNTTVSWTTAFGDSNYTVSCTGRFVTSGVPMSGGINSVSTNSVVFTTVAATAAAAQYTNIDCQAVHD